MRLEVQKFLATGTLADLELQYGIGAKRHPRYPNLVMLKYSQINAPMGERIVQECRGIILDESNDWSVVSRPYNKFFNSGEGHAAPIDWSSARVYEKVDGSLMTLYWYAGEWHVASSGMPDAGGPMCGYEGAKTFADLFWRVWRDKNMMMPDDTGLCFMFELMTPYNRVVVPHTESRIVLHGARNIETGEEITPENARVHDLDWWETVKSYPLGSVAECLAAAEELRPLECEGYVVCDKHFNRIKIKSPKYVALAHAKEGFNPRAILELVRKNEGDEFLSYFPELRADFDKTKALYLKMNNDIREVYAAIKGIPAQRDFAGEALKHPFSAVLFSLRAGKVDSPESFMRDATIFAVEKMVGMGVTV